MGERENAIDYYQQALRLQPDLSAARMEIGKVMMQQEDYLGAIVEFRQVTEEEPENADAHYNLGMALQERERTDEAIESLNTARDLYEQQNNNAGVEMAEKALEDLQD
jgi:tetratricopeptide (TPR) repeat protein